MKLDAVGVTSSNIATTVVFYRVLGFQFGTYAPDTQHLEPLTPDGSARLMIDMKQIIQNIIGEPPRPGNHSSFAIRYDKPKEIDDVCTRIKQAGFIVTHDPWDAFWGQRYAIVQDPDGYKIDLYAELKT